MKPLAPIWSIVEAQKWVLPPFPTPPFPLPPTLFHFLFLCMFNNKVEIQFTYHTFHLLVSFCVSRFTYSGHYTCVEPCRTCSFVTLISPLSVFKVHPCHSIYPYFAPFYCKIILVAWYHILFIHSSFGGQLGSFHFLDIMNNAAINIPRKFLCRHMFSLLVGIEVLGHMMTL